MEIKKALNPFLFIRRLSCPRSVAIWLTLKLTICMYLHFLTTSFLYLVVTLDFKKVLGLVLAGKSGLKARPQSAFTAFRALLPSASYSAEWSGGVCQPVADKNDHLAHFLKIETRKTAIIVSSGLSHPAQEVQIQKSSPNCHYYLQRAVTRLDGQQCPLVWDQIMAFFLGQRNPLRI